MNRENAFDPELPDDKDGLAVVPGDSHRFRLLLRAPAAPVATLLWLPALGIAARHYLPFAEALAARGIAVFVHEWRGHGSSNLRADRNTDWGYHELLQFDLSASADVIDQHYPTLPKIVGGHSLGGQLAACLLALRPHTATRLWLIASGAPFWRVFPNPHRWLLPLVYRLLPWLADRNGALPGRAIGFGGKEARGVMHDWARTGLSGCYAGKGIDTDLEATLANIVVDVDAVLFSDDWLAPMPSLRFLTSKMRHGSVHADTLDAAGLGLRADHFAWMKGSAPVAAALAKRLHSLA